MNTASFKIKQNRSIQRRNFTTVRSSRCELIQPAAIKSSISLFKVQSPSLYVHDTNCIHYLDSMVYKKKIANCILSKYTLYVPISTFIYIYFDKHYTKKKIRKKINNYKKRYSPLLLILLVCFVMYYKNYISSAPGNC